MRHPLLFLGMAFVFVISIPLVGSAQPPIFGGNSKTLQRLPDDQIEGRIWEYKGKPKTAPKEGEEALKLEGKFRIEDPAVFEVSARISLPGGGVKKVIDAIRKGEDIELKVPSQPQQKRIGEYRKLKGGKIRIDFNDEKSLHGVMILRLKKKSSDVWIGSYREMEGKKTTRYWNVELRPIED